MHLALRLLSGVLIVIALLRSAPAAATTIDPRLFEELVLGADFVGVVECEQAGGIVAHYRVIESWKGPKVGELISIRVAVNYWEPQFPIALCGERYYVTAFKQPRSRIMSTTSGGGVPLWWRDLPADYALPLFQGRDRLTKEDEKSPEFEKTRKSAQALIALKPAEQEAALLKALTEKYVIGTRSRFPYEDEEDDGKVKAAQKVLLERFAPLNTAEAIVGELLKLAQSDQEKWGYRTWSVLESGGGTEAVKALRRLPADDLPWEKRDLERLITSIADKGKNDAVPAKPDAPAKEPSKPTPAELAELRLLFVKSAEGKDRQSAKQFGETFEKLTLHDPAPVVEYLAKHGSDFDNGYVLGSYFAWRCGKDRAKHLAALLDVKDEYIRVAGAVYLCFEDADAGVAALKKLTKLGGDPGVWAALTLARRGHKDAVPRMLEVFHYDAAKDEIPRSGMSSVPHRNLQKRVLVLLSNSGRRGGVPLPEIPDDEEQVQAFLLDWWKRHGDRVVLHDPWMKTLEKQKID